MARKEYRIRTDVLAKAIDDHHHTHEEFAKSIQISKGYWSELFRRKRAVSPKIRRAILDHKFVKGLAENHVFDVTLKNAEARHATAVG